MYNYSCKKTCKCKNKSHNLKRIVLTGGPGAGKTATLETLKKTLCEHVSVLPESATILFGGGFWRHDSMAGKKAAQIAIYHIQDQLEKIVLEEGASAVAICDRGTIDGLAYWPEDESLFWESVKSTKEKEFSRYNTIVHLRTPTKKNGYNNTTNPVRIETATEARIIDEKIIKTWDGHPRRFFIESRDNFFEKVSEVIKLILSEIPDCCKI